MLQIFYIKVTKLTDGCERMWAWERGGGEEGRRGGGEEGRRGGGRVGFCIFDGEDKQGEGEKNVAEDD